VLYEKTLVCGVAINSLEITLILQPARSDIKIGPDSAHGKRCTAAEQTPDVPGTTVKTLEAKIWNHACKNV